MSAPHFAVGAARSLDALASAARDLRRRADEAEASIATAEAFMRRLAHLGVAEPDRLPRAAGHPDAVAWEWFRSESHAFCAGRLWLRVEAHPDGLMWRKRHAHCDLSACDESGTARFADGALALAPRFEALLRGIAAGDGAWHRLAGDGRPHWSERGGEL